MPVKFDDISKVATVLLNDDYQCANCVLKTKQKTNYGGTVLSTQVDLFQGKDCATPTKITWKWPSPLGFANVSIDKLEVDKGGKFKLEASSDKLYPKLKVECKSDLVDINKIMAGLTYTGVQNAQLKLDIKAMKPQDFTGEATFTQGIVTYGLKTSGGMPELGMRVVQGPLFVSLLAKEKFSAYTAHVHYVANPDFKCGATYQHGGKGGGNSAVAVSYKGFGKVKIAQDHTLSYSVKNDVAKGFSVISGFSFNRLTGKTSWGAQLSIE